MYRTIPCRKRALFSFLPFAIFIPVLLLSYSAGAQTGQSPPAEKNELAICKFKQNNKAYELKANKLGIFPQVSHLKPSAVFPITVVYPQGKAGEKIVLAAEDGGSFDNNKSVMAVSLDAGKKCVFNFRLTNNEGLFQITLRKGEDIKVIQLWVGEE